MQSKSEMHYRGESGKSFDWVATSAPGGDNTSGVDITYELITAADGTGTLRITMRGSAKSVWSKAWETAKDAMIGIAGYWFGAGGGI